MSLTKKHLTQHYRIIFLLACLASAFFAYVIYGLTPVAQSGVAPIIFTIERGEALGGISAGLEDGGLIRSAASFRWYSLFSGAAHALKPGTYEVSPSESAVTMIEKFVAGPTDIEVVIKEGATLKDIDATLAASGIAYAGAIIEFPISEVRATYPFLGKVKSLEGFLFPDTYRFSPQSNPKAVITKLLDNFEVKAWPALALAGADAYQKLIIASLVEKEVPDSEKDREIVAGIILRRMNIGMGLQIDATILYARCNGALLTCRDTQLVRDDYSLPSPYNTYLNRGLPPTPISNPGVHAITAALHPQKTNYLYYLSDPKTKKTIFSETFDEHNEKRARYLGL